MTAQIRFDQYLLEVEYSRGYGDDYHCLDWIDLDVVSGMIELDNSEEMLAMTDEECYVCQELFGWLIEKKLIEGLRDDTV